ncbi:DJ-1/PfpI family protein [Sphingorhabdus sp.]|uniref:DJ-1/PfpI family protein n=1 Tax=Sphingorhabdus sp. TaxID=1902408 RepID=UPI003BB08FA2|nr:DJ-1/PfpI family protein [Sphingomonadales bacterium]MBL0022487.1 DJ-1/PfpI family protein [Sphingomonadales bacterium]
MNIVFVLFDGVTQLDFAGPVQFLSRIPGAATHVVSKDGAAVKTDAGFSILPNGNFANCPQADILCVPGGFGVAPALADQEIVGFVREQAKGAEWVTSVCTGAFILGAAGLLQGKRATTHWGYAHLLPLVGAVHEDARVVRDGNLLTAGGVTSGIDFALELIAAAKGPELAQTLQLALEYDPAPPFPGGHPRSAPPAIVEGLKARVYSKSAVEMEGAINALR